MTLCLITGEVDFLDVVLVHSKATIVIADSVFVEVKSKYLYIY